MEKRFRSPNYPALSLPDAVQRVALVYKNQHTHGAPREVLAKSMGYNTLNGASATAISALIKYGLLEGRGEDVRVSDRAMRILHPQSQEEKAEAIRDAANEPTLFQELSEKFPGKMPSEEILRNHLLRSGFATNAVSSVILAYRDTKDFAERELSGHFGPVETTQEHGAMTPQPMHSTVEIRPAHFQQLIDSKGEDKQIGRYDFEGGAYVRIVSQGDVDTETALEMAEVIINLKRKELERRKREAEKAAPVMAKETGNGDEQDT